MLLDRRDGQVHNIRYLGERMTLDTAQDEGAPRLGRQRLDHPLEPPQLVTRGQHALVRHASLQVLDIGHEVERHDYLAALPIDQDIARDARHEGEAVADLPPVFRSERARQCLGHDIVDFVDVVQDPADPMTQDRLVRIDGILEPRELL